MSVKMSVPLKVVLPFYYNHDGRVRGRYSCHGHCQLCTNRSRREKAAASSSIPCLVDRCFSKRASKCEKQYAASYSHPERILTLPWSTGHENRETKSKNRTTKSKIISTVLVNYSSTVPKKSHSYYEGRLDKSEKDTKTEDGWQCPLDIPTPACKDVADFDSACSGLSYKAECLSLSRTSSYI